MSDDIRVPVLIVGGGPVGMTLAMCLHAQNVPCLIVNSEEAPRWHPKGSTQNARTMEIYRQLGIAKTLRGMGLGQDYPLDIGYFTRLTSWELTRIAQPSEQEKQARIGNDNAFNLGWKLAALTQSWGGPALLASYEIERRPVAQRNTSAGKALARSVGAVPIGDAINETSPEGDAARKAAADFLATFGEEFASLGVQLGARYDNSPVIAGDGGEAPPDDPATYTPSGVPGGRAPHLWLDGHRSLYDELGTGFTLLRFDRSAETGAMEKAAAAAHVPLAIVDVASEPGRDLYARDLALIRPDLVVAWRGNRLPDDSASLLAHVTGR